MKLKPINFIEPYYRDNLPQTNDLDGVLVKLPIYSNRYITLAPKEAIEINVENSIEIDFYDSVVSLFTTDTNYPIMDCKVEEEPGPTPPGPTPPGPIPTTYTLIVDDSTAEDLGMVSYTIDELPEGFYDLFGHLGSKLNLVANTTIDSEEKSVTYDNITVLQNYVKDSNNDIVRKTGLTASLEDIFVNYGESGFVVGYTMNMADMSQIFTPLLGVTEESGVLNFDDNSVLLSTALNIDDGAIYQPTTYSYNLIEDNSYDLALNNYSAMPYSTNESNATFSFPYESVPIESGKYYNVNCTDLSTSVSYSDISKCVPVAASNKYRDGKDIYTAENLTDINIMRSYDVESNSNGAIISNCKTGNDFIEYDDSNTLFIGTYLGGVITGPIEHTPTTSHEVFSITFNMNQRPYVYQNTEMSLNLVANEWYSLTLKNNTTGEEDTIIGLCGYITQNDYLELYMDYTANTVWSSSLVEILDNYTGTEGESGTGYFVNLKQWLDGNAESYTLTLNSGVYPQNQS